MAKRIILLYAPALMVLWAMPAFAQDKLSLAGDVQGVKKELQELRAMFKVQAETHKAEIGRLNKKIDDLEKSRAAGDGLPSGDDELTGRFDANTIELGQVATELFDQWLDEAIQVGDLVVQIEYPSG